MLDEIELLNEMEQLDERNIHANKLFQSFRSVQTDLAPEHFNAALLYFVACLILGALHSEEDGVERVFIRRPNVPALIEDMAQLIKRYSAGLASRDGLIAALSVEFISRLMDQFEPLEPRISKRKGFARRVFDIILRRTLSEDCRISLFHSHVVASLAVSLSKTNTRIIETFPYSGATCVTAKVLKKDLDIYYWENHGHPYAHQDLIRLRLKVRNLSQYPLPLDHVELDASDLTVVDGGQALGHQFPALATLEKLIKQGALSNIALVIVDQAHGRELPEALQHYIAAHDLLEAVIDLPSQDASGTRTVFTAWLLNIDKKHPNETIFIDATHLVDAGYFEPTWFAAAVVERWRSSLFKMNRKDFIQVLDSSLKGLFLKYFEDGYKDLSGFCRTLVTKKLDIAPGLTARAHLAQQKGKAGLLSLDNRPLLAVLIEEVAGPSCSYIIGNNGEGKSLLLKDLIYPLDQARLDSVGIAFGALDRFPLEPPADSLFDYQGARGAADAQRRQEFLYTLSASLLDIYQEHLRLKTFTRVLKLLDFNHRHYLVPISDPDRQIDDWERRLAILELQEDLHAPLGDENYEPGLQREEKGPIVPFTEMSSGEQQILSLLIRICSKAGEHTVFLIDEPEISLHVSWQQRLPALLSHIAQVFGCSFVVATHSPIIVANARGAISHCFLARKQVLTPIPAHQRHSVESILLDGFNTYTPDNREINERCAVLVSRAIRVTNQPGQVDFRQRKVLLDALRIMKRTMSESTSKKHDERFRQDIKLIAQADAAIKELFKRAKSGVQQ